MTFTANDAGLVVHVSRRSTLALASSWLLGARRDIAVVTTELHAGAERLVADAMRATWLPAAAAALPARRAVRLPATCVRLPIACLTIACPACATLGEPPAPASQPR